MLPPALALMPVSPQSELSDGIAMLVAGNDRIQAIITQMEEICRTIEVGPGLAQPAGSAPCMCSPYTHTSPVLWAVPSSVPYPQPHQDAPGQQHACAGGGLGTGIPSPAAAPASHPGTPQGRGPKEPGDVPGFPTQPWGWGRGRSRAAP